MGPTLSRDPERQVWQNYHSGWRISNENSFQVRILNVYLHPQVLCSGLKWVRLRTPFQNHSRVSHSLPGDLLANDEIPMPARNSKFETASWRRLSRAQSGRSGDA